MNFEPILNHLPINYLTYFNAPRGDDRDLCRRDFDRGWADVFARARDVQRVLWVTSATANSQISALIAPDAKV